MMGTDFRSRVWPRVSYRRGRTSTLALFFGMVNGRLDIESSKPADGHSRAADSMAVLNS